MLKEKVVIYLRHSIIGEIRRYILLNKAKRKWRLQNLHNETTICRNFNFDLVTIGKMTYGEVDPFISSDNGCLKIGNYVSIAPDVKFLVSVEHYTDHISTFPFQVKVLKNLTWEAFGKGDIIVEDDVWIGYGSTIMSGVHIGQGAVVAAGSVVTKDVPAYAMVGGVPAKVIKYRFSTEMIIELMKVDYNQLDKTLIKEHIDDLYQGPKNTDQLDWLPKKQ